jgi:hypothetical protein
VNTVILVPRRADNGHRDKLWAFCRERWRAFFPDWPIVEGHHDTGPFNRSVAANLAARDAGEWDVAVLIDSDIIANPDAVATAVEVAHATGRMVISHNERIMLNKIGTQKVLDGFDGSWRVRQMVDTVYTDSVSCCVAVPRKLWDTVGGLPEFMDAWGHEDSVFEICASTLGPGRSIRLASELFHLHHELQPEAKNKTNPLRQANRATWDRFQQVDGDPDAVRALLEQCRNPPPELGPSRIPRVLHRTVPTETSDEVEGWWRRFAELHPGWELRTYREPLDPKDWPLTSHVWDRCKSGAQRAGLIRLEYLVTYGGFHIDADMEPVRSLEPLTRCSAVAAYEDANCVPDAFLGCEPNHPAFVLMLEKAVAAVGGGADAWNSGPGVTTEVLPGRPDVLVLPPGVSFDVHYLEKAELTTRPHPPWSFMRHHWHGSWLSDAQRRSIDKRQRV